MGMPVQTWSSIVSRIHIVLPEPDKVRYAAQAAREGKSLGAWLREAAEERLRQAEPAVRLDTLEDLESFFRACDVRETAPEPDWEEHLRVMRRSQTEGLEVT
jgi:hypothetical protein